VERSHTDRAQGLYYLDRLSQTAGDTETPDRESLLDACGRKATPLLLFNSVIRSSQGPGGYPDGEGSVERSHADRAQGLYQLDGFTQRPGGT